MTYEATPSEVETVGATPKPARPRALFALDTCPMCSYKLDGLPREHSCPECGFKYDSDMFLLYGWRLTMLRMSQRTFSRIAVFVVAFLGFSPLLGFGWSWWTAWLLAILAFMLLAVVFLYLRRAEQRDDRGMIRYLMTNEGVVTTSGRLLPWPSYSHLVLLQDGGDRWRILIHPAWWRVFTLSPIVSIVFLGAFSEAEAIRMELQKRIGSARDRARASP